DSDPNAHGDMWDAVLLTTKNFPRVWISDGSGKKGPSPASRMFEFLRARCRLAPTISYPSVLALLANLPAEALDAPSFQQQFDAALWHGATESTDGSRSAHQGSRSAHREGVALVTAICECSAFLWTRTLKSTSDSDVVAAVGKEAAKQIDRLWHYYLQRPESAEEMAEPIVKLYCKIESLAAKYDRDLLARIWAQASWFALQRLNGAAIFPIVHLIARTAQLDTVSHADLVGHARKLLVAFCQLATQSPDDDAARSLIQLLSQHARDVVFEEGFADKFSARLERAGSVGDAVQLVLSRAQHVAQDTGSVEQAALSIDAYAAALLREAHTAESKALATVTELLTELPGSDLARHTVFAMEFVRLSGGVAVLASASHDQLERFVLQSTLAFVLIREALLLASSHAEWACDAFGASVASVVDVEMADARVLAQADAAATQIQDVVSDVLELTVVHELPLTEASELSGGAGKLGAPADSERWLNALISALEGVEILQDGGSAWILVLGRMIEWCVWAGAPDAAAVEAGLASALARMFQTAQTAAMTGVATVVMRAMDLRRLCARAPAMRSALLDVVGRAARTAESGNMGQLVAELELVAELLPAESETLNSEAPRIAKLVLALPSQLQNQSEDTGAAVVAALAIVQRLSTGTASLEAQTAVDLVRLCVRWITAANGVSAVTVLAAAARAIEALAQVQNVVDDAG
ncbi:hypothetical protein GGF47_003103, partial [Coemansia sp. RSA 2524]